MIRWIVCAVLALTAGLCFDLPEAQARPRRGRVAVVVGGRRAAVRVRVPGRRPRRVRRAIIVGQAPVVVEPIQTLWC